MKIHGFSPITRSHIDILNLLLQSESGFPQPFQQKIDACPFEVFLIGGHLQPNEQHFLTDEGSTTISLLHQLWDEYWNHNPINANLINEGLMKVSTFGKRVNNFANLNDGFVFQMKDDTEKLRFFVMLRRDERIILPISEITFLVNYWKLAQGYLPLHSSGVIHRGGLYLFIGPSGAGKSTVSQISIRMGDDVLDEDQVLIYHTADKEYFADAWGYSFRRGQVPIRAIFHLVKDRFDRIIPLPKSKIAKFVSDQSLVILSNQISDENLKNIFHRAAQIARAIPGYELHFTKSPKFWKLIDSEIPFR
jgi:hypothetical protein